MKIVYKDYINSLKKRSKINIVERRIIEKADRINELKSLVPILNNNIKTKLIIKKELLHQNIELYEIVEKWLGN